MKDESRVTGDPLRTPVSDEKMSERVLLPRQDRGTDGRGVPQLGDPVTYLFPTVKISRWFSAQGSRRGAEGEKNPMRSTHSNLTCCKKYQ